MGLLIRKKKLIENEIDKEIIQNNVFIEDDEIVETIDNVEDIIDEVETEIKIIGTDIILDSVYLRFEFKSNIDGYSVDVKTSTYYNKPQFKTSKVEIMTSVPNRILNIKLKETEKQDVDTIKLYLKDIYEKDGWDVEIF